MISLFRSLTLLATMVSAATLAVGTSVNADVATNLSGSARSHAMGNTGVTMIDHRSFTENPASLALFAPAPDVTLTLGPYVWSGEELYEFSRWSMGAAISFGKKRFAKSSPFCFGAAYYVDRFSYGEFARTAEGSPEIIGTYESRSITHNLILSTGYDGPVRLGLGTSLKLINDRLTDQGAGQGQDVPDPSTFALDLGFLATVPIDLSASSDHMSVRSGLSLWPACGVTYGNLFGELTYLDGGQSDPVQRPLRIGLSVEFLQQRHGFREFSLMAIYEIEKTYDGFANARADLNHIGAEAGFLQTIYVRYGRMRFSDNDATQRTWGVGFSSRGLAEYLAGEQYKSGELPHKSFLSTVSLELSYAKYPEGEFFSPTTTGTDLFEIGLVISL